MGNFKSGFVALIGKPNAGKSTLMNRILGEKIAIVSNKPQTTRNKISGILTSDDYQIIFVDTPGIHSIHNKLDEFMIAQVQNAVKEVDLIVLIVDGIHGIDDDIRSIIGKFSRTKIPFYIVINKSDLLNEKQIENINNKIKEFNKIKKTIVMSALSGKGTDEFIKSVVKDLPNGPKYYPDDIATDQPERFIAAELIREKSLQFLRDEVPHGIGVEILNFHEREDKEIIDVNAVIYCERESHKGIIIGKNGKMLKKIGQESRKEIENLVGMKINLQLWVKVNEGWRNKNNALKELGYK